MVLIRCEPWGLTTLVRYRSLVKLAFCLHEAQLSSIRTISEKKMRASCVIVLAADKWGTFELVNPKHKDWASMQCSKFSVLTSLSAMAEIRRENKLNHDKEEMMSTLSLNFLLKYMKYRQVTLKKCYLFLVFL